MCRGIPILVNLWKLNGTTRNHALYLIWELQAKEPRILLICQEDTPRCCHNLWEVVAQW